MKLTIDNKIFEQFPALTLGVVVAKNINNSGQNSAVLDLLRGQMDMIRGSYQLDSLAAEPKMKAWRQAFDTFGAKSKKYQCSVENLYRMILEGVELRHINTVVDIYNYISLKYAVPVGGDDTDKVDGDIDLCLADGTEPFIRLNSEEVDHPKSGEVIYRDDKEVLCRRWNWRECDKSKMTEQTRNIALVIEGLAPTTRSEVETATSELRALIDQYCGGRSETHILDADSPAIEF
jgi:lysyl-tRNA synthetase class 2